MHEQSLEAKLVETIANIEERTDSELIAIIKETLMSVGTGYPIDDVNEQYQLIYKVLDGRLSQQNVTHPNHFEDLWDFYTYWKDNGLDTYASRRTYVRKLYRESAGQESHWVGINPVIRDVARTRFESSHYADAVEASFKEINSRVKEEVRQLTGEVYDGAALMNKAFSPKQPIIILEDLETEDGRNVQQGYMQMYAGAMTAIRNPKAHSNIEIDLEEALPLIQLASLLFSKFEAATKRGRSSSEAKQPDDKNKGVYVRIADPDNHEKLLKLKEIASRYSGGEPIILVLGSDKKSAIRLPFKVKVTKTFIEELVGTFGQESVVVRK